MQTLTVDDVNRVRGNVARAHALAAGRFRDAFEAQPDVPPNERWLAHLEIQAAALLETAESVQLRDGRIRYDVTEQRIVTPYVVAGQPVFPHFTIRRTPLAVFEYWMVVSEILASSAWSVTKLIAISGEYDDALRRMQQPQIVRVLHGLLLPTAEWRDDGTAMLEVTVYTRAAEERIERRLLTLDGSNEFHFHSRDLLAEGRAGVDV
jgi:hypothetical protein